MICDLTAAASAAFIPRQPKLFFEQLLIKFRFLDWPNI